MKKISICSAVLLSLLTTSAFADITVGENGDVHISSSGSAVNVGTGITVDGVGSHVNMHDNATTSGKSYPRNQQRMAVPLADTGSVFAIDGAGGTTSHECQGGSVKIDGASNTVLLIGYCPKVSVGGAGNQVDVDQTSKIEVIGAANQIVWHQKVNNKAPRVASSGAGNKVYRGSH